MATERLLDGIGRERMHRLQLVLQRCAAALAALSARGDPGAGSMPPAPMQAMTARGSSDAVQKANALHLKVGNDMLRVGKTLVYIQSSIHNRNYSTSRLFKFISSKLHIQAKRKSPYIQHSAHSSRVARPELAEA